MSEIKISWFPCPMKAVTSVFKKHNRMDKANYRPISILSNLSKVLEGCLYNQLYPFFKKLFSIQQCGLRKRFNAQHFISRLLKK